MTEQSNPQVWSDHFGLALNPKHVQKPPELGTTRKLVVIALIGIVYLTSWFERDHIIAAAGGNAALLSILASLLGLSVTLHVWDLRRHAWTSEEWDGAIEG